MFLIDVSPSMGKTREVEVVDGLTGDIRTIETTNLEWSLQYVKLKIQEMVCSNVLYCCLGALLWYRSITAERQTSVVSYFLVQKVVTHQFASLKHRNYCF